VVHHLRPLGIAANVIQASFFRLYVVLLTFGSLVATYSTVKDADDLPGVTVLLFRFAHKVLSITANLASCERLFSAYGMILDK
jgi:hypothetical protein